MKTYRGVRTDGQCSVTIETDGAAGRQTLNPRLDLWNHSPSGFEWGYGGSGLALAIVADHLGEDAQACRLHQPFKGKVIGGLVRDAWTVTSEQVHRAIDEIEAEWPA